MVTINNETKHMTKTQKKWLGVFLAMFIVPEVLWSPVVNYLYQLSQTGKIGNTYPFHKTFLDHPDNVNTLSSILFIQFLGLFISAVYLIVLRKNIQNKTALWLSIIILALLSAVTFFVFGLSVSLRNIGF